MASIMDCWNHTISSWFKIFIHLPPRLHFQLYKIRLPIIGHVLQVCDENWWSGHPQKKSRGWSKLQPHPRQVVQETIKAKRASHELSMKQRAERANKVHIGGSNKPIMKKVHPSDQPGPEVITKASPQPYLEARLQTESAMEPTM